MYQVSEEEFEQMVARAMDDLHDQLAHVENMAIIVEPEPSSEQRHQLHLHNGALLFGLYEGLPLPQRNGVNKLLPDKITLFQKPIEAIVHNHQQLQEQIKRTLWHELAHYYGLDHKRIHELE